MLPSLIIASNNAHKIEEIKAVLADRFDLLSLDEIGYKEEIPETGSTFIENALIKARTIYSKFNKNCFADDSGLEVVSLNNEHFKDGVQQPYVERDELTIAADPVLQYMSEKELLKAVETAKKEMLKASKEMDFLLAAKLRDEMFALENLYNEKFTKKS